MIIETERTLEFLKEPFFWILSGITSFFLSITANLLTPYFKQTITAKRMERRRKVQDEQLALYIKMLRFQENPSLRISTKLDVVYWILRSVLLFVVALFFLVFISFILPNMLAAIPAFLIMALCMARSGQWIVQGKSNIHAAFLADKRETVLGDYCASKKCEVMSPDAVDFLRKWDRVKFKLLFDDLKNDTKKQSEKMLDSPDCEV
jgi:hypothetical protein